MAGHWRYFEERISTFPRSAQDVDADGFGVSLEGDIDDGVADAEIADFYSLEGFGKRGVIELQPANPWRRWMRPRQDCRVMKTAPALQAWGEQATG